MIRYVLLFHVISSFESIWAEGSNASLLDTVCLMHGWAINWAGGPYYQLRQAHTPFEIMLGKR
jgi:hypothetical protein